MSWAILICTVAVAVFYIYRYMNEPGTSNDGDCVPDGRMRFLK
jgi:hypothetical protein